VIDERELDRAIDAAARQMMAGEPSRALGSDVMARVRKDAAPVPRRFVWATAAASVVLCAAIVAMLFSRTPQTIPPVLAAPPFAIAQPPVRVEPPIVTPNDTRPAPRVNRPVPIGRSAVTAMVLPADAFPIEPLEAEAIALAAIDVPRLEPEAPASIEALTIDELTIEPLAASND
jgi:hypothetical protein